MGRRAAPWLWLWLCALALRPLPGLPQTAATNVPPEDQDGSGDDSDGFSGSGAGALPDLTASPPTSFTWKGVGLLTALPTAPEPTGAEPTGAEPTAASTSSLPAAGAGEGRERDTALLAHLEPGFPGREKTARPPSESTPHPTTTHHRAPTPGATAAPAPGTRHPEVRDRRPDHHGTSAPEGRGPLDPHPADPHPADPHPAATAERGLSATERTAEAGAATPFPTGEGSGEEDFTFDVSAESTTGAPEEPEKPKELPVDGGAPQGLLDRKEVLGGVIAGGLVGLLCAVCLVGFMLYRMKKKDEGSYSLEEPKQANGGAYQKPSKQEEFYA